MFAKEKISSAQMGMILYQTVVGTSILLMPSITTLLAGNDMWLTPIWSSAGGFLMVWVTFRLHQLSPNGTIFASMERIVGKIPGKIIGFLFLLFSLHIAGATVRDYGEFIVNHFFEKTPILVVMVSMVVVCLLAVRGGIETIARCVQLFVPVVILLLLLNFVLTIPDMNMNNMLPFMEKGIGPSLKGSVIVEGWFCQFMLISFLYPSLSDKHKAMKVGFISVLATCITMVLTNLAVLLLLGSYITANFHYPVLLASRYIMIADFIEHVEAMIMMVWVLGAFLKISFLTYTIAVGAAEWLQLDGYRHLVFPVGILISVMSMWIAPNMQELTQFIATSGTVYIITGYLGLPLLLLGIASVRRLR